MSHQGSDPPKDELLPEPPLSRWDDEGGAGSCGPQTDPASVEDRVEFPKMAEAEWTALHVCVIALENLVISLLATASNVQLAQARDMASIIAPRPGFTPHPLTTHAAAHMVDLVERAVRFRDKTAE